MFQPSWRVPSRSVHSWRVHSWSVSSMLARFLRAALLAHQLLLASEPLTPLRNVGRKNTRETVVRCLSAFCSNPSLLSAWCAASPLSVRTPHSSPRGALPLRFLCEPLTPLRVQLFSLFPPHSKRVPPRPPSRPAMTRPRQALLAQSGGSYSLSAAGNPGY